MPPTLPATLSAHLEPESRSAWEFAESPAPAPVARTRPCRQDLITAANGMAMASGLGGGLVALLVGDTWTSALLQSGAATLFALIFLRLFAIVAARAMGDRT